MAVMIIYTPNILLHFLVTILDNRTMRNAYQHWLRFKLVVQGFILPLIFLAYDESYFEAKICSDYLPYFGVNKSEIDIQYDYIDQTNFTLLVQQEGQAKMNLDMLEQEISPEE